MNDRNQRELLIERVKDDFTFKANNTNKQKLLWESVNDTFTTFDKKVNEIANDPSSPCIRESIDWQRGLIQTERAKDWADTGIANDGENELPVEQIIEVAKDVFNIGTPISVANNEKQQMLAEVNKVCYQLAVGLASFSTTGRGLSVCMTKLQEARKSFIRAVNENYGLPY